MLKLKVNIHIKYNYDRGLYNDPSLESFIQNIRILCVYIHICIYV